MNSKDQGKSGHHSQGDHVTFKVLSVLGTLVVLGTAGATSYNYLHTTFANKTELADSVGAVQKRIEAQTDESIDYRIKEKLEELNAIERRVLRGDATVYDEDRKIELKSQIQLLRDRVIKRNTDNGA